MKASRGGRRARQTPLTSRQETIETPNDETAQKLQRPLRLPPEILLHIFENCPLSVDTQWTLMHVNKGLFSIMERKLYKSVTYRGRARTSDDIQVDCGEGRYATDHPPHRLRHVELLHVEQPLSPRHRLPRANLMPNLSVAWLETDGNDGLDAKVAHVVLFLQPRTIVLQGSVTRNMNAVLRDFTEDVASLSLDRTISTVVYSFDAYRFDYPEPETQPQCGIRDYVYYYPLADRIAADISRAPHDQRLPTRFMRGRAHQNLTPEALVNGFADALIVDPYAQHTFLDVHLWSPDFWKVADGDPQLVIEEFKAQLALSFDRSFRRKGREPPNYLERVRFMSVAEYLNTERPDLSPAMFPRVKTSVIRSVEQQYRVRILPRNADSG